MEILPLFYVASRRLVNSYICFKCTWCFRNVSNCLQ